MKATIIHGLPENRHDNKTPATEAFESMEAALEQRSGIFICGFPRCPPHALHTQTVMP